MKIKIENISKFFDDTKALKKVNLAIAKGSIYGLVGSNGAGKTTLLKIMAGLYTPDTGEICIDNEKVFENENLKSKIIYLPDILYFFPGYRIKDMATFYKRIYHSFNDARFEKLKQVFKIDVKMKIHKLSKGMQRQVAFWLALSIMPEILILDEPLDGLDPIMRQVIKNLIIQEVAEREMTVIIASHDLNEIEGLSNFIGILHEGTVVLSKDLDDLKTDIHKVQIVIKEGDLQDFYKDFSIVNDESRGELKILVVKGDKEKIINYLEKLQPIIIEILPLTLEEIFIYELRGVGYEVKNINL
ncbi:MAG: ABC transporter ATP-binding protein [Clostridiaceae bacterium]|nr:ABC transporter ATP-binding protein [Clostridiaceae bacterium]